IRGHMKGLPSLTQGGSPVPESGSPGFVRGAHSNMCPYRDISAATTPAGTGIASEAGGSVAVGTGGVVTLL
ncbi:MAG: hypothetical protein ACLPYS_15535, partial [Vulcanimicrobiaceae bacterium]